MKDLMEKTLKVLETVKPKSQLPLQVNFGHTCIGGPSKSKSQTTRWSHKVNIFLHIFIYGYAASDKL